MKSKKSYLLIAFLGGIAVACQKSENVTSENTGNQNDVSQNFRTAEDSLQKNIGENINPNNFVEGVNNPFFPLNVGDTYHYLTTFNDAGAISYVNDEFNVTQETKEILGVTCTVVHIVSSWEGALIEDSYDWFAQDVRGNVWNFGEDTKDYDSEGNVDSSGSWEAGVNGAIPGIQMWAHPRAHIGQAYNKELAPGVAEDKAKVIDGNVIANVPFGLFQNCIRIKEFSPLDPGVNSYRSYKEGIGTLSSATPDAGEKSVLISITH
jgi:hypothetical protein